LKAKQFLVGLPMDERPAFAQQYTVLKRELGSSEVAFNKMMSRRSAPTNMQIDYENDAKAKQFIRDLPINERPAFASKYTELKKTMGSEAAFNKMMSQRMQGNANDTNVMEHYGVSLDDKPPVSANVPYSSNDSSLSSLYQHYGLT
jgi:predicted nucleotidyltransferase